MLIIFQHTSRLIPLEQRNGNRFSLPDPGHVPCQKPALAYNWSIAFFPSIKRRQTDSSVPIRGKLTRHFRHTPQQTNGRVIQ